MGVVFGARPAILADYGSRRSHRGKRSLSVRGLHLGIIRVRQLSCRAIEFNLAERIHGRVPLRIRSIIGEDPARAVERTVTSQKRIQHERECP